MALNGYYDVTAYGADPSGTNPSNVAVQMAVFACTSATPSGGVVWFPPGTYKITANTGPAITLGSGVEPRGAAAGSTNIKTSATGVAQTIVSSNGANFVGLRDLTFTGAGTAGSPAPVAVQFTNASDVKVADCIFTANLGQTLNFAAVTDAEVMGCSFTNVGHNDGTNRTDAVAVGSSSVGIRIHDNYFNGCSYGAVFVQGNECDVSHNTLVNVTASGIYFSGSDTRVALNSIDTVNSPATGVAAAAIEADGAANFCILGNNVTNSVGDGIAIPNGWSDGIIAGNNLHNSGGATTTDSGIRVAGKTGPTNQGLVIMANNAYTDSGLPATPYGMHFSTSGPEAFNTAIMGNNLYGTITQRIADANNLLVDDSNTIIGNGYWIERKHTSAPASTTATTMTTLESVTISAGSIRPTSGVRITAAGTTTGTSATKTVNLGYSVVNNILNGLHWTPASTSTWQMLCVITNNDFAGSTKNTQQAVMVLFWADGVLQQAKEVILSGIDTTSSHPVTFQAKNSAGSFTVDFFTIERC